eukprot:759268-Hanusia_phi.AAC.1
MQAAKILPRRSRNEQSSIAKKESLSLVREDIVRLFDMRQTDAAKMLGISLTALKCVCRKLGIMKWPYSRFRPSAQTSDTDSQSRMLSIPQQERSEQPSPCGSSIDFTGCEEPSLNENLNFCNTYGPGSRIVCSQENARVRGQILLASGQQPPLDEACWEMTSPAGLKVDDYLHEHIHILEPSWIAWYMVTDELLVPDTDQEACIVNQMVTQIPNSCMNPSGMMLSD